MLYGTNGWSEWQDEGEEGLRQQRVASEQVVAARVAGRPDVLSCDRERLTRLLLVICLGIGLVTGLWLRGLEFAAVVAEAWRDTERPVMQGRVVGEIDRPDRPRPQVNQPVRRAMNQPAAHRQQTPGSRQVGSSRDRARTKGLLRYVSAQVGPGETTNEALRSVGRIAEGIDRILHGPRTFASTGAGGIGRRRDAGRIGFDVAGDDGGSSVDDLFRNLTQPDHGASVLPARHRPARQIADADPLSTGVSYQPGGRTRHSIMKVVQQNITGLRYLYTTWLRGQPGLKGKITVRLAIDEFGKVVSVTVMDSTLPDPALEAAIVGQIRAWRFDRIDKPGDITEVIHPFVFST